MQHPKMNRMPRGMPEQIPEGPLGDLFRHFFGDPRGGFGGPEEHGAPGGPNGDPIEAKSLGSGFIISKDGYVMTKLVRGCWRLVRRLVLTIPSPPVL